MNAPFGIGVRRFQTVGLHPSFETQGCLKSIPKLGPGCYDVKYREDHIQIPNWTHELRAEEYARTLGHKVKIVKEDKGWGGPAVQDLKDFLTLAERKPGSVKINTGLSTAPRFPRIKRFVTPPPGTYTLPQRKPCIKILNVPPSFEWDGFEERFKRKFRGSGLAPNRYTVKDVPKKIISLRGPYDLFTGPRDGSTIKNHFAPPKHYGPDWIPSVPTDMDRLKRPEHAHYGKWRKGDRFLRIPTTRIMLTSITLCRRDPRSPAPGTYDPEVVKCSLPYVKYPPFGMGVLKARPEIGFKIQPGTGRYNPRLLERYVDGHTNVFISTSPRTLSLVRPKLNAF